MKNKYKATVKLHKSIEKIQINMKRIMNSFRVYIFITYSCGRNTTYIEEIDFTNKTGLCDVKCKNLGLELDLKDISIYDSEMDTVTYRSHNELSMGVAFNCG